MIDKRNAEMLQARSRRPLSTAETHSPSPFAAAGYTSDLSDIESGSPPFRARRHASPNIDQDDLYYHDDILQKKRRSSGTNNEPICIPDDEKEDDIEEEPFVHR